MTKEQEVRARLMKTVLTWSHVITLSILALAAVCNLGGLCAIVFAKELAESVTAYAQAWQGFFVAGVLGYNAKSAIENTLKIQNDLKQLEKTSGATSTEENG